MVFQDLLLLICLFWSDVALIFQEASSMVLMALIDERSIGISLRMYPSYAFLFWSCVIHIFGCNLHCIISFALFERLRYVLL